MISVSFKPFNITVIQIYAPTRNAEEAEVEWLYKDLQDHPHGKELQKSKMAIWGGLTNSCEKKRSKKQRRKRKDISI